MIGAVARIGAALLLAALWWLLVVVRRRVRRGRAGQPLRLRDPVVLVHGFMGFGERRGRLLRPRYFRGVGKHLEQLGVTVYAPHLEAAASVEVRAQTLRRYLDGLDDRRVHLIAHSMGGLDARYGIAHLGLHARVASLVTIGTPHHGTPLAELATSLMGERLGLPQIWRLMGLGVDALFDLTPESLGRFNAQTPNRRGVFYGSVVAHVRADAPSLHPLLRTTWRYLAERSGDNDGVVPTSSQRWGRVVRRIEADHWAEIGWSRGLDAPALYEDLVRELRGLGL
ncbi:MAG: alpha/beta fold hydrolase [Myxococcota bacterium]